MDKLDKAIEDFKGKKKILLDKQPEKSYNEVDVDKLDHLDKQLQIVSSKWSGEIVLDKQPEKCYSEIDITHLCPEPIEQIGLSDTYLPFVLTKLKICDNNTDARKLISSGLVKVNFEVMLNSYTTKELSNFLLEVNGKKYEIFKID